MPFGGHFLVGSIGATGRRLNAGRRISLSNAGQNIAMRMVRRTDTAWSGEWGSARAYDVLRLQQSRHDLHEIAGPVPDIELVFENTLPGVLAGAG